MNATAIHPRVPSYGHEVKEHEAGKKVRQVARTLRIDAEKVILWALDLAIFTYIAGTVIAVLVYTP